MDHAIATRVGSRLGDLAATGRTDDARLLLRLCERLRVAETGCWEWTGALRNGYGRTSTKGRYISVHREVYELLVERLAREVTLDHLCQNRSCANPGHLEPVSQSVNAQRGWANEETPRGNRNRDKTHCPQGHPYDDANTYRRADGSRRCRTCMAAQRAQRDTDPAKYARRLELKRASYHRVKDDRLPPTRERTHCPRGHAYDDENTYRTSTGGRGCRECRRIWWRENGAAVRARRRART